MKTKPFMDGDFLLDNAFARTLYHDYAATAPIYDYHCHLPPDQIATDHRFANLTDAWLRGDHYKWRALRANGIAERYITGDGSDEEKFLHWAETVPYTVRNPLYHWTHLELRRYFGVTDLLTPATAKAIYDDCNAKLADPDYSVRNLLRKMNVKLVCTTDDPLDDLHWHEQIRRDGFEVRVYPAYRPDKTLAVENPAALNKWLDRLSELTGLEVRDFTAFLEAMQKRHDYFHERGCRLSDYGLDRAYADPYTASEIHTIFQKVRSGQPVSSPEQLMYKSAVLYELARMDAKSGWTLQMHLGPLRNTNTRLLKSLGPDTGFDSMGDFPQGQALAQFLDRLDQQNELPQTILYNNNPRDNALFATMIGNFQDGSVPGKMQYGAAWWYLDQKDGIEEHLQILSNMGLLSRLVGMLTDSRSFLSFPRHEYFRRILCNLIGRDVEGGLLPHDPDWLGKIVGDICFENARNYFAMDCPA